MAESGKGGPIIQVTDLDATFQALRNQDPSKMRELSVPRTPDYKSIPNQNYAPTTSVSGAFGGGMHRYASASANGGMIYGQPQFFSPVHTPINWQIPSKRLETYQWARFFYCLTPDNKVLMSDGTEKKICEINTGDKIIDENGNVQQVLKVHTRNIEENILEITLGGNNIQTSITKSHEIKIVQKESWEKSSDTVWSERKKQERARDFGKTKLDEVWKEAGNVQVGDWMISPELKPGTGFMPEILSDNICWLLGLFAADGSYYWYTYKKERKYPKGIRITLSNDEKNTIGEKVKKLIHEELGMSIKEYKNGNGNCYDAVLHNVTIAKLFYSIIGNGCVSKNICKEFIHNASQSQLLNFISGFSDGDGCLSNSMGNQIRTSSPHFALQLGIICTKLNLTHSHNWQNNKETTFRIQEEGEYTSPTVPSCCIRISRESCNLLKDTCVKYSKLTKAHHHKIREYLTINNKTYRKIIKIEQKKYQGTVYDLEVENNHTYCVNGCIVHNSNEPKVAASIDFYSYFPMNGFENECKDRDVKKYFDKLVKRIDLSKWLRLISHEVHLLGDCFPFIEISCEQCGGAGRTGDELCEHDGGTVRRVVILNPDYVEVHTSPMNPEPVIALKPDEELINMVQRRTPGHERLTPEVRALVTSGRPIRLDNRNVYHLKYGEGGYDRYGIGMVRRLFPVLSYKTKLMVAQWIVAERLIVPIKIVKVGSDERPAGPADIAAVQEQLAQTSNDPNLTIVTHHAFEIDWIGASGKVLTLSNEFELINQEILDGMMINNALLNGEGPNFCLSDDTRIMTNNGLKYRKELDIEKDMIATFNKDTGALEYQKATKKWEYDYNSIDGNSKPMKRFLTNRIDMLVTPNHKMLYATRKISFRKEGFGEWTTVDASDVKERSRFRACVDKWIGTTKEKEDYFGIKKEDFLQIVGWYISEGSRHKDKQRNDKIYSVDIAQSHIANPDVYSKMKTVLSANNICKIYPSSKNSFAISNRCNRNLVSYLVNNCGQLSNQKMIPMDIKNMSKESLNILLAALVECDGSDRPATIKKPTDKKYYSYTTVSTQLRDDVIEILFKLGFSPRFAKIEFDSPNLQTQYTIYWSDTENGKFPVLDSRTWNGFNNPQTKNQVISDEDYIGKVWCVEVPNHFIITERNGLFGIHGNSNAAVGIEAMIERLQTFRREVANWVEQKIYLPEAKRQGFIDESANSEEEEYIYPKIKWNSMHLRDQQQFRTFVLQLYEKGLLSAQTVLEAFDFDPDQEIERKRYDAIQMAAAGGAMGGAGGAAGGMPGGMGGGFGGGGGGGMPPMPGGEAGGMPGGMGGGEAPIAAPGAAAGPAPMATTKNSITTTSEANMANPSNYGGRILKKKTRERLDSERQKVYKGMQSSQQGQGMTGVRDAKGRIVYTKCERQLMDQLSAYSKNGLIRYPVSTQYPVKFGSIEYPLDFAFPHLKIAIEADGEAFHSSPKQITHDQERDMKLTQLGWTVLRFTDSEIEDQAERVMSSILKTIMQKEVSLEQQKKMINK